MAGQRGGRGVFQQQYLLTTVYSYLPYKERLKKRKKDYSIYTQPPPPPPPPPPPRATRYPPPKNHVHHTSIRNAVVDVVVVVYLSHRLISRHMIVVVAHNLNPRTDIRSKTATYQMQISGTFAAPMNFRTFPQDEQVLPITVALQFDDTETTNPRTAVSFDPVYAQLDSWITSGKKKALTRLSHTHTHTHTYMHISYPR